MLSYSDRLSTKTQDEGLGLIVPWFPVGDLGLNTEWLGLSIISLTAHIFHKLNNILYSFYFILKVKWNFEKKKQYEHYWTNLVQVGR